MYNIHLFLILIGMEVYVIVVVVDFHNTLIEKTMTTI